MVLATLCSVLLTAVVVSYPLLARSHGTNHLPTRNADGQLYCSEQPAIKSYHIHAVFTGNDMPAVKEALALRGQFVRFWNPNMTMCTFSHSNPGEGQRDVCYFDFDDSKGAFPYSPSPVFGASNYAFFIPSSHNLLANAWWRRYRGQDNRVHYVNHVNTGCQNDDHTVFAQFDYKYPWSVDTTAFYCCHEGPPGCTCDNVQYQFVAGNFTPTQTRCLYVNRTTGGQSRLTTGDCDGPHARFDLGSWRETIYDAQNNGTDSVLFAQIENYGDIHENTYSCLVAQPQHIEANTTAVAGTQAAGVAIGDCRYSPPNITQFGWVPETFYAGTRDLYGSMTELGHIKTPSGLCLSSSLTSPVGGDTDEDFFLGKCTEYNILRRVRLLD